MDRPEKPRRDFLFVATGACAALGAVAIARPLIGHMSPAADAVLIQGMDVDLSKLEEGMQMRVLYRGKPVAIRHRTPAEIKAARADDLADLRHPETDQERLRPKPDGTYDPRFFVFHPICTHFGNVVQKSSDPSEGWWCPSHGGYFDTSGRVRRGLPPKNMEIPDYFWTSETSITLRERTLFERLEAKEL